MPDEYVGSGVEEGRTHRRVRELTKTTTANSRETTFRDLDFTNSGFPQKFARFLRAIRQSLQLRASVARLISFEWRLSTQGPPIDR